MPRPMSAEEIAADMADRIRKGDYVPGQKLETHRRLAEMYDVSISTITKVMLILRMMGLVEGSQGRGVYVADELPRAD